LASLETQTFDGFEVVVVLDGSEDESRSIAEASPLGARIVDSPPRGVAAALNLGLAACQGDLVARLDADDVCEPDRFALQAEYMETNRSVAVLGTGAQLIDRADRPIGVRRMPTGAATVGRRLAFSNCVIHPSVMFRRSAVVALGGYDERVRFGEDYDLWLRVVLRDEIANLSDPLIRYRVHEGQATRRLALPPDQAGLLLDRKLEVARRVGVPASAVRAFHALWLTRHRRLGRAPTES
jgi:glycosyltransferase involved in cell wall biosynthesis